MEANGEREPLLQTDVSLRGGGTYAIFPENDVTGKIANLSRL